MARLCLTKRDGLVEPGHDDSVELDCAASGKIPIVKPKATTRYQDVVCDPRRKGTVSLCGPPGFRMTRATGDEIKIRGFSPGDEAAVRELFVRVNRLLAPPDMKDAFEAYIAQSLKEEIDRVADYYRERAGGFWVAVGGQRIVGTFGLESSGDEAMELRRMYVDPDVRRRGIARRMLYFAEQECRRRGRQRMELSTSELQQEALSLYRNAGYTLAREEFAVAASNKTVGGGIRRYHFSKML
jgi:GNAT superfamily N-acetyltransferase